MEASLWAEGAVIRGKYHILAKIGQGGMATVYKVEHTHFHELRALKVMAPELAKDPTFRKRFEHEAVLTRKLQHPNAVRVEDLDEAEDGRPFIVMEYIEGCSLKTVIAEEAPLSAGLACTIAKQVASALDAAHRLGMVHRDIKPDNIALVSPSASEDLRPLAAEVIGPGRTGKEARSANPPITQSLDHPTAKVLDFGIAKIKEGVLETTGMNLTLTGTGMAIGTASYMSPEQALGKKGDELDGRSDIYSLGVVMYQMLTGELPLQADTPIQMLMAHVQTPPRPLQQTPYGQQIPVTIAGLVMRCLEKDPHRRPANAAAFIDELDRAMLPTAPARAIQTGTIQESSRPQSQAVGPPDHSLRLGSGVAISRWAKSSVFLAATIVILVGTWLFVNSRSGSNRPLTVNPRESAGESRAVPAQRPAPSALGTGSQNPSAESGAASQPARPPNSARANPALQQKNTETRLLSTTSSVGKRSVEATPRTYEAPVIPSASGESKITVEELSKQPRPSLAPSEVNHEASGAPQATAIQQPSERATGSQVNTVDLKEITAQITLCRFHYEKGEYEKAIAECQKGLQIDPSNAELKELLRKVNNAKIWDSNQERPKQ